MCQQLNVMLIGGSKGGGKMEGLVHTVLAYYSFMPSTISAIPHYLVMWKIIQNFQSDYEAFAIHCFVPIENARSPYLGPSSLGMARKFLHLFLC
jgi:hypothetical protein